MSAGSMTWVLILWLSFTPGRFVSVEVPMPSEAACHRAVALYVASPTPNERVASCKPVK